MADTQGVKVNAGDFKKMPELAMVEGGEKKSVEKFKRIWRKLLVLPYFVGLVWTCLHPVVSVLTGESKCRGWYIDEHSLEFKFADTSSQSEPQHLKIAAPKRSITHLCDAFQNNSATNIACHSHGESFDIATVVPLANALDPLDEAIVFVISTPLNDDWATSKLHYTLLHSLKRLADPRATPWLAKTFILVSPKTSKVSLEDTVSNFLDAYLGARQPSSAVAPLPPKLSGAILRTMVVVDVEDNSFKGIVRRREQMEPGQTEFSILPQGRRGLLPNMDLVFLVGKLFEKSSFLNKRKHPRSTFLVHGYTRQSKDAESYIDETSKTYALDDKVKLWAKEMTNMGLFAYSLAMGPFPSHAPALDRGIDSITIRARFDGYYRRDPAVELIQYVEYLARSFSNLHERLHHSFTLYLMPSPRKFVSHVEFLLPNILLLLPLAIRAFGTVLWDDGLHLQAIGIAILVTTISMGVMLLSSLTGPDIASMNTWLFVMYALAFAVWKTQCLKGSKGSTADYQKILRSLQFVACTIAVYTLVPIAFAHASLAYMPSVLWTPLLAFPCYGKDSKEGKVLTWLGPMLVFLTAPPVLLVPRIFASYTTFVQFAYVPLHLQLFLLSTTRLLQ